MDEILRIKQRLDKLEKYMEDRIKQQITFPLDFQSIGILNKYFLSIVDDSLYNTNVAGEQFRNILVKQNNKFNLIAVTTKFITFVANPTTNVLSLGIDLITGGQGVLSDDQFIQIFSPGTAPGGLDNAGGYFVVNSTGSTIQLAASPGGAAIDITSAGIGTQYIASST